MKYIVVDHPAVDRLISNRRLQSDEFLEGQQLVALFLGTDNSDQFIPGVQITWNSNGILLTAKKPDKTTKYIVIDCEESQLFKGLDSHDCLFLIQKLFRLAKKLWEGLSLNFSEKVMNGTTKVVIFPFPGYQQRPYRAVIERDPDHERLGKREQQGNFLLVYKSGNESGDASKETASLTNFRKACEAIHNLRVATPESSTLSSYDQAQNNPLLVSELLNSNRGDNAGHFRRYEDWLPKLTEHQRNFVTSSVSGAHRIEGAAGTGKTLSLILKAINTLRLAEDGDEECHLAFVTHSEATKASLSEAFSVIDDRSFQNRDRLKSKQSLTIKTLFHLCKDMLKHTISESEFLDRDALDTKETQLLYISNSLASVADTDFSVQSKLMSNDFVHFLKNEDDWNVVLMLQHEFSVCIKGRAGSNFDSYLDTPQLKYGLPINNKQDKGYIFTIFRHYEKSLRDVGSFDNDDIVLSTIGQMDTPIWRRRREREGYDLIFIDETHLFNINELHLFHYFLKNTNVHKIVYSVDRSQAVGDRGWNSNDLDVAIDEHATSSDGTNRLRTVFRSSPEIVSLAFSVVSSGATLFTNFDNPTESTSSAFTDEDEQKATKPSYIEIVGDDRLVECAFERANVIASELNCQKSEVLITTLDDRLFKELKEFARKRNKPVSALTRRGDLLSVKEAASRGHFILGHADYVGGLEFQAVIIVGVDEGRVPAKRNSEGDASKSFLSYAAHNRLYVAISRAKYRVELLADKARGPSALLETPLSQNLLERVA